MRRLAFLLAVTLTPGSALADRVPALTDPVTKQACGECHMAFQPAFLPAASWERIMDNLSSHFGEDASMAPAKAATVRRVLVEGAGDRQGGKVARKYMTGVQPGGAPLRITENPAFQRKHGFPASTWARPEVMTRSNCPACHKAADRGDYEED